MSKFKGLKKVVFYLLLSTMILVQLIPSFSAETYSQKDESDYELWFDNTKSSELHVIDAEGEFLIPARPLIEAFPISCEWDAEIKKFVFTYKNSVLVMDGGSNEYILDNTPYTMPVAPAIYEGRYYLPLKTILQAFGFSVSSDSDKKTIKVYTNSNITPNPASVINITSPSDGKEVYFGVTMGPNYPITPSHGVIPITVDIDKGEKTIESVSFYCGDTYLGESKDNEFDWNVDLKSCLFYREVFIKAKVKFTDGTEYESKEVNLKIFVAHVDVYSTPTPPESTILGDLNGDFEINAIDMALLVKYILGKIDEKGLCINNADMNSDGEINSIDAALIRRVLLGFE